MKKLQLFFGLLFFLLTAFLTTQNELISYPSHFPKPSYPFEENPLDSAKVELGRMLFYEPALSKDSSISCASCHLPSNAFAHPDAISIGIKNQKGTRNAPPLFNLAWHDEFMWDGAIPHIDKQAFAPITNSKEMGEQMYDVAKKIKAIPKYKALFAKLFGDTIITGERIINSIAQFELTLVSANSKYDAVIQGKATFSEQEQKGYVLYQKNCSSCHTEPLFSTFGFANNGLPTDSILKDLGRSLVSYRKKDQQKFKIPSLRNLSFTAPYMHDGRFQTLNEVINHYTNGIEKHASLSKELKTPIVFSSVEQSDLISFLLTLDDPKFIETKAFHDPFK